MLLPLSSCCRSCVVKVHVAKLAPAVMSGRGSMCNVEMWKYELKTVKPVINVTPSAESLQNHFSLRHDLLFIFFNFLPQRHLSCFSRLNDLPVVLIWHPSGIWLLIFLKLLWWESSYMSSDCLDMRCILPQLWHLSWIVSGCFYFSDLFIRWNYPWISAPGGALATVYMDHIIRVEQLDHDFVPDPGTMAFPWPLALAHLSTPPPLFLSCLHSELWGWDSLSYCLCIMGPKSQR